MHERNLRFEETARLGFCQQKNTPCQDHSFEHDNKLISDLIQSIEK